MDLLEDLKMLLLNFNFVMVYIIHEMLVLLKNNLNYLKDSIFKFFFNRFSFLFTFSTTYNHEKFKPERRKQN